MSQDPHAQFDQNVLEMIEQSPVGAVPHTPTYQESVRRLYASHQVYASADYKDGHVTVRSLAKLPCFQASNLDALAAGAIELAALESDTSIYDRYVQSLPTALRAKAETFRARVVIRHTHHRKHQSAGATEPTALADPMHSLLLVPGTGPHPGLPGNYLYGAVAESTLPGGAKWRIELRDMDDGAAYFEAATRPEVLAKAQEVVESAPFQLSELSVLEFKLN